MNKEIFDQLAADEQPVATKLDQTAEAMKVPQDFQWNLETQLMDAYQNKTQPVKSWFSKLIVPASWALIAITGFILFNWATRSLVPRTETSNNASNTEVPVENFEASVRNGNICAGPLALAHGFSVTVTNEDKSALISLMVKNEINELRSFTWSPDGKHLAILMNTTGNGNIYISDLNGAPPQPLIPSSELGYLMDVSWSQDGNYLAMWSLQNNTIVFVVNSDGTELHKVELGMQIFGTPQFAPKNESIVFYGADNATAGLFEFSLNDSQVKLISGKVEDESGFAFSPDGTKLAYFEMDRDLGEARLIEETLDTGNVVTLASLPIPKGSGSSIPEVANLSWSNDVKKLVFEFGRSASDRTIYLASAAETGLIKVVESAHAPTISPDGRCLAYITNKQVYILDLDQVTESSSSAVPLVVADLPVGGTSDFRLDRLQWQP